jgi:adenylate cyclase
VRTVPFWEVLAGKHGPETFADRIVLVGATAAALYDVRYAPFRRGSRLFYGVETNANIAHTMLEATPLRDARGFWPWGLYALLVGAFVGWAIWHSREWLAAAIGVGVLGLLALPVFWVGVVVLHQVVPYGAILWAALIPAAMALYERLGVEKREVQHQFATYVSPDVLHELAHHPELVRRGRRRTVTLLFADVRGSTTLCEQIAPDTWIAQLNEYLSEMSDAIFAYDGYLDKFMGDGIMTIWNAFGDQENHAELAVKAAAQMLERLRLLNEQWAEQPDRVPFQIGIGLHTGEAVIGNVGSDRRAQYTAIGDTVNSASRIELLTKEFRAPLLISESTAALIREDVALRELGSAELLGREQPVQLLTLEGYPGEVMGHVRQETK